MENAVDICECVRVSVPSLILDIDLSLSGLDRTKLNAALKRQRSSFFSAGELMQPLIASSSSQAFDIPVPTAGQRSEINENFRYALESQRAFDEALEAT